MAITEEISILIRLIIAHLLTDFIFQPPSWIKDKKDSGAPENYTCTFS